MIHTTPYMPVPPSPPRRSVESAAQEARSSESGGLASILSRMFPRGGKMDDVTVVVAFVTAANAAGGRG